MSAEAEDTTAEIVALNSVIVTYKGQTYAVAPRDDWDMDIIEAIEALRFASALRSILGDDQYEAWKGRNRAGDVSLFFKALQEVMGGN